MARRVLTALAGIFQSRHYWVGEQLFRFDFAIAGLLGRFLDNEPATWLTKLARQRNALIEYAE